MNNQNNVITMEGLPFTSSSTVTGRQSFVGGNGGDGIVDRETKSYVDRSMDAVKAQNDARFIEVLSRLDQMPKFWPLVFSGFIGIAGAIGIVFAILSYASDRFDGGLSAGVILEDSRQNSVRINQMFNAAKSRDARIEAILKAAESDNKITE